MEPKYKRILLKVSGEALAGDKKTGFDYDILTNICKSIKKCVDAGVQVGVVVLSLIHISEPTRPY